MSMYLSVALYVSALQLCTFAALGDKVQIFQPGLREIAPDFENICGEPEIWRRLTKDPSVDGVQNINWVKLDKLMADYLSTKDGEIKVLETEIEGLDARIAEKKAGEEAAPMPKEEIETLIVKGLVPFAADGGDALTVAQESFCGKPNRPTRGPRGANREAVTKFKEAAQAYWQSKVRIHPEFKSECERLLPQGANPYESYCPSLCQKFTDLAQKFSDEVAGETAGSTSTELAEERLKKVDKLAACRTAVSSCKSAQTFISNLGAQITKQKKQIDGRFEEYQIAEENLADAAYTLEDVVAHLAAENLALVAADEALKKSTGDTSTAEGIVADLKEKEGNLGVELAGLTAALEAARVKLFEARDADKVVTKIKGFVATMAGNMRMLFTKAALEPLDKIGLGKETDMQDYTEKDVRPLAGNLDDTLKHLKGYCTGTAATAFTKVQHLVQLDEMCDFGDPATVLEELTTTVSKTKDGIKAKIDDLKTWFNPLKGQSEMTPERVAEFAELGEPTNLRETVSVFSKTEIFRNYLKQWQLKGLFLRLKAKLQDVVVLADQAHTDLGKQLAAVMAKIEIAKALKAAALQKLEDAKQQASSDSEAKLKLETSVAALSASQVQLDDDYARLKAEFEKAKKNWDKSKEDLVEAHKAATSFLQSWTDDDNSMMSMVVEQAKKELAMMRRALRAVEESFSRL